MLGREKLKGMIEFKHYGYKHITTTSFGEVESELAPVRSDTLGQVVEARVSMMSRQVVKGVEADRLERLKFRFADQIVFYFYGGFIERLHVALNHLGNHDIRETRKVLLDVLNDIHGR